MSMETMQWLNENTLVGFTQERGKAWTYRADLQSDEPNHYDGAIPVEDVRRRLFNWQAVEGDVQSNVLLPDGVLTIKDDTRKTIVRPDTGKILGIFKTGYEIHQFDEWLLDEVARLLDDDLQVGSAGLLKGGAVAFVTIEVPETITTPEGVDFRPHLLAATSLDGSLSTTYGRTVTVAVCDNTMAAGLGEAKQSGEIFKVKHSRYSKMKLQDARSALSIVHTMADDFAQQVAALTSHKVSPVEWQKFQDLLVPLPEDAGRSRTMAENKRDVLNKLWNHDERVAPWAGTAWGVIAAVNTASHHEFNVRGERVERNMMRAVTGEFDKLDRGTLTTLAAAQA
jgi:phage/plasmid-like protein (TIGR03299 family)